MSRVLELTEVSVVRDGHRLLDSVTWVVAEGERWIVLGPNGAGKTTLLHLASATIFPTAGAVRILGEPLGGVDVFELRPRIGFASAAQADRLPGGEWVLDVVMTAAHAVVGRWRESYDSLDETRARGLLDLLGVGALAGRRYGTLSEGERKRVQLARALMTDPELLLLDEPTAGLDLSGREDLLCRLAGMAADPAAPGLVLVTHHVEEIPPGFTHVLLIRSGRLVAQGPLETTLTSASLTECFGFGLTVSRNGDRWTARAAVGP